MAGEECANLGVKKEYSKRSGWISDMMQDWQQEGKHLLLAGLCQEVSGAFG